MPTLSQPELLPGPFAYNGDKNDIPDASASLGAASYQQGFPPITQLPVNAGGIPPQRNDFNGILNALSQHTFWQQSGGMYAWSVTLDYAVPSMVVGSDKEIYFALQPSGPGTPAGAKDPTVAAGKAYWQNIAYVLPVATATKLGGVMVNKGGLQVSASGLLSLLLMQGGGLNLNATGQLYVDTADFSEEMLRAFLEGIIADGGGLGFDSSGKLYVDADAFSEDLLERFLKSIRVPIWLTRNKSFYVNITTGSDTLDEGRGESAGKPFKTLQACVNYVCDNYNVSRYICTINVAPGIYSYFGIADFARTTGYIMITGESAATTVVEATNRSVGSFSAGVWRLTKIKFREVVSDIPVGGAWVEGNALSVAGTAQVSLGDGFEAEIIAEPSVTVVSTGAFRAITLADNSLLTIYNARISANDKTSGQIVKARMVGLAGYGSSVCNLRGVNAGSTCLEIDGDFNISVTANGSYVGRNAVDMPIVTGNSQGKRYYALNGGRIMTQGGGPDYFPGTTAGTIEASTYSWYK